MKALVLGGENTFIRDNFAKRLAKFNIDVNWIWHWDHSKPVSKLPSQCECVVVVKDMTGHSQRNVVRHLAKRAGVRFVEIPRKWSVAQGHLKAMGFTDGSEPINESIPGEDFDAVFARVVSLSAAMYEAKAERPSANTVAEELGIPTWHLAMQRGIDQGVAQASGNVAETAEERGWTIAELTEMCLSDEPEMIRNFDDMCIFLADLTGLPNNKALKKDVRKVIPIIRKKWVKCSRKSHSHPDRIYIDGLKSKWLEGFARTYWEKYEVFPPYGKSDSFAKVIFDSRLTRSVFDFVLAELEAELIPTETVLVPTPEPIAEPPQAEEGLIPTPLPVEPEPVKTEPTPEPVKVKKTKKTKKPNKIVKSKAIRDAIKKYFKHLGVVPDSKIAELAGCSASTVRTYRLEFNIAKQWDKENEVQDQPLLELKEFDSTSQNEVAQLRQKVSDLESRLVSLEAKLESVLGTVDKTEKTPNSLGSKADELIAAGFKVKLEVTS